MVCPERVGQIGERRYRLGYDEAGAFSYGNTAQFGRKPHGRSSIHRCGVDGFFRKHAQLNASQREHEIHIAGWRAAWIVIRGERYSATAIYERTSWCVWDP